MASRKDSRSFPFNDEIAALLTECSNTVRDNPDLLEQRPTTTTAISTLSNGSPPGQTGVHDANLIEAFKLYLANRRNASVSTGPISIATPIPTATDSTITTPTSNESTRTTPTESSTPTPTELTNSTPTTLVTNLNPPPKSISMYRETINDRDRLLVQNADLLAEKAELEAQLKHHEATKLEAAELRFNERGLKKRLADDSRYAIRTLEHELEKVREHRYHLKMTLHELTAQEERLTGAIKFFNGEDSSDSEDENVPLSARKRPKTTAQAAPPAALTISAPPKNGSNPPAPLRVHIASFVPKITGAFINAVESPIISEIAKLKRDEIYTKLPKVSNYSASFVTLMMCTEKAVTALKLKGIPRYSDEPSVDAIVGFLKDRGIRTTGIAVKSVLVAIAMPRTEVLNRNIAMILRDVPFPHLSKADRAGPSSSGSA